MTDRQTLVLRKLETFLTPGYIPPYVEQSHDVTHPQRMCLIAEKIAGNDIDLFLLKVAIWFHNIDRTSYSYNGQQDQWRNDGVMGNFMVQYYPEVFSIDDIKLIVDAVERHSRLNEPDDSTLTVYLKDCDRLDTVGAIGLARIIQYSTYHGHAIWRPEDFSGVAQSTKENDLRSIVQNVRRALEWENMLRVEKAKELYGHRFRFLYAYLVQMENELREIDLLPPYLS